jgi:hypothetical protein
MSTIRRDFRASPHRTGSETWEAIARLLAPDDKSLARKELMSIVGTASQLIATEAVKDHPIIASGSGPRVRVYCLYDDAALNAENSKESALAFNATEKDWKVSIPVEAEDLSWSKAEIKKYSTRISVREKTEAVEGDDEGEEKQQTAAASMTVDLKEFLKT